MIERTNVIIQAPVFSLSGYGLHARDTVMSMFNSGKYNMSVVPVGWGTSGTHESSKDVEDALIFMCNNKISEGSNFVWVQFGVPHEFRRITKVNIGITAGLESEPYPQHWAQYCNQMNALIVPSKFVRERFVQCGVTVPIYIVPEGVDTSVFNNESPFASEPSSVETMFDLPTKFNFLVVGQWLQGLVGEDRKNIPLSALAVIDAFQDDPNIGIVIKTAIHNNSSPDRYMLVEKFKMLMGEKAKNRVHLLHGELSEKEMAKLYHHPQIQAFLSLTHGEGYGRQIAEAAACDLPVLVTGWGGHMDFVSPDFATILEHNMVAVPQSTWMPELLGPNQNWAQPDFDKAKNRLRRCHDNYSVAQERAIKLGEIIRKDWSLERSTEVLLSALDRIISENNISTAQVGRIII